MNALPEPLPEPLPVTPSFRLDGRRAIVTGAGRGIGLGCAAAFAAAGAEVTLVARSSDEIEAAAAQIGPNARAVTLDVSDIARVRAFFAAEEPFHILVNNAGTNRPMPVCDVEEADYDAVLDLNLKAAFFVAQACARRMIETQTPGSLIHVSSQMGHVGGPERSLYCASKWGLEGLSKAMALDLAPHGIRSNTLCPTFIETALTRPYFEDEAFLASVLAKIQLGRLGQVTDLMGAALFLASEASALMTGTHMIIDGGWTAA